MLFGIQFGFRARLIVGGGGEDVERGFMAACREEAVRGGTIRA
jgi:hypothetical protein